MDDDKEVNGDEIDEDAQWGVTKIKGAGGFVLFGPDRSGITVFRPSLDAASRAPAHSPVDSHLLIPTRENIDYYYRHDNQLHHHHHHNDLPLTSTIMDHNYGWYRLDSTLRPPESCHSQNMVMMNNQILYLFGGGTPSLLRPSIRTEVHWSTCDLSKIDDMIHETRIVAYATPGTFVPPTIQSSSGVSSGVWKRQPSLPSTPLPLKIAAVVRVEGW
jgi:hypothetical protein